MARRGKLKLTYLAKSRRWVKKWRGVQYYFPLSEGETKETSYRRVVAEWEQRRALLAEDSYLPHRRAWLTDLDECERMMEEAKEHLRRNSYGRYADWAALIRASIDLRRPHDSLPPPPGMKHFPLPENTLGPTNQ
jgi:hypothetical protein